jgi:NAD(P)-dependent dehydrogenase (short-subunit alcohol dehydrogenase family)|tara:strand:- start:4309 stop:5067 length:759 start_codon:yes stop_codon:yes gene_type:complete
MKTRLSGKSILVTGGESGIGRAIVLRCLSEGASVVIAGINEEDISKTVSDAEADGAKERISAIVTDVTNSEQVQNAIDLTINNYGRLDAAIANAGAFCASTPFGEWDIDEWERVINVNLTGVFYVLHAAAKVLISQGEGGSLIATGSSTGIRPIPNLIPYTSSKGGVHQMLRGLAVEMAPHKIKVNTIVPGMAETRPVMTQQGYVEAGLKAVPMNEIVQPEELAAFVAFSLSDEVPHMTGTLLKVDAGRTSA